MTTARSLIVAPSWIGDAVLSHGLIQLLKATHPAADIDVVAPPWVMPVYQRMTEVTGVIENPFAHGDLRLLDRRAFGRSLGQAGARGYSNAFVLPNTFKSALLTWFAGIPTVTAWRGEARGWIVSDCRDLDEAVYPTMAERFAALAVPASAPPPARVPLPHLQVDIENRRVVAQRLGLATDQPVVVICPGAEYGPAKRWPARHAAAYAKTQRDKGAQVWLLGGKGDHAIAEEIRSLSDDSVRNLCGETTLADAIDLLSLAGHVVTNDSGLMHIACAVGVPVVALYGSSSPAFTPPLSDRAQIVKLDIPCSPCFKRECPLGHFQCLNNLSPELVTESVIALKSKLNRD